MKNLKLFAVLCLLIGIAYYFEEIHSKKQQDDKLKKVQVFKNLDQTKKFEFKNYSLELDDIWKVTNINYIASEQLIKDFKYILSHILTLQELSIEKENDYFSQTSLDLVVHTGKTSTKYTLGDVSKVSGKFYLKVHSKNPKIYLCEDKSKFTDAYTSEADLGIKKYLRLKAIFSGDQFLFMERKLFHRIDINKVKKLNIKNRHNRPYTLDLKQNATQPPVLKKLKYKRLSDVVSFLFSKTLAIGLITNGQNILTNEISSIEIESEKQNIRLKLFAGLNGQYGKYVKFEGDSFIYRLSDETPAIFQLFVQDYWNKKFLINQKLKGLSDFQFSLSLDGKKFYSFKVDDIKKFDFKSLDPKVYSINKNLMNFLFNLIFNLVDFKEASYVMEQQKDDSNELYLKIFKHKFGVRLEDQQIRVVDYTSKLIYIFKYDTQPLQATSLKRIFTVKEK